MLLELYGYCSGDRRSHELAEAYHGQLVEAVQHYAMFRKSAPAQIDYQSVVRLPKSHRCLNTDRG